MRQIVVVGAGGFGRETLDVLLAINEAENSVWDVLGVYDDAPSEANKNRLADRNVDWLGGLPRVWKGNELYYVIAVGKPSLRRRLSVRCDALGWKAATLIHPSASIGSMTSLAPGTVVCSGAVISTNVRLEDHVHVNPNATVGHDSFLGPFVSVNPAATVSGDVTLSDGVLVGAAAVILQGLRVGENATIGAAACVVKNVAQNTTVKGIPAR